MKRFCDNASCARCGGTGWADAPGTRTEARCYDACHLASKRGHADAATSAAEIAQRHHDEILGTLDMTAWGEDELWQIQCHLDSLAEILTALGKPTERTLLMDWPERLMTGEESER